MASLKELRRLKDEERTLVLVASKINDQLNRLKVEELALQSTIRMNEKAEETDDVIITEQRDGHVSEKEQALTGEQEVDEISCSDQTGTGNEESELLPAIDLTVSQSTEDAVYDVEEEEDDDDEDELNNMMTDLQE